ncbi:fumarylacetoacetate hydrolase family protein [Gulosibacter molinativorax]|uniref:FAA hydrolase family protein n=1 Tax=Gulosibacter molinativorax TaxID=256821 RepID=A0ABT7CC86_9MICO|nr:fumarylacetoacetate hydrolase family protein [Gulosibacter molinativorax]MDJ1372703.1 FAA hydrolase family protein [Gulosibacter molinativorax]QUY63182.1 Fumarylacetoacetate (FAA) hydrolase family protein [Gulosibacter molinativorax]
MTKIARFQHLGDARLGVVSGDDYIDVTKAYAALLASEGELNAAAIAQGELSPDSLAFFRGGDRTLSALQDAVAHAESLPDADAREAGIRVSQSSTDTLVPIPNPPKIVCVARNYGKHAEEAGLQISEIPILFPRFAATQIAHGEPIVVPKVSHEVDWEGELAVVIGKGGRHITREDAFEHVAGYTVFNDVSVRDYQFRVTQYTGGKNFHASGPVGPHIALADEGLDPHNLRITTVINGVVKQDASTNEFIFDIPALIEHISEFIQLEPGDIIPTGTPAGVGFKRNPPEYLRDGDVVEITVEGIGTLRNPVINEHSEETSA